MKFLLLLIGLFLASAGGAAAQSCNFSVSTLNFGTVNLLSGSSVDGTATIDISCTNILSISLAARLCLICGTARLARFFSANHLRTVQSYVRPVSAVIDRWPR
ncbi:spore coat protein U domain-containing protein [Rhizobium sp. XQZ8]|uniref:spore coat protein U domain-containing protein n=1 Tax=Rhizobium populisoli TaxID=2859785 RepID=UPI001CA4F5C1|nr:spore coat protein U domain-containing protein [Rhizobium populisoli]MBW6424944.1 spore coat protein U domain-containing protein [Rhizobium populisoli]